MPLRPPPGPPGPGAVLFIDQQLLPAPAFSSSSRPSPGSKSGDALSPGLVSHRSWPQRVPRAPAAGSAVGRESALLVDLFVDRGGSLVLAEENWRSYGVNKSEQQCYQLQFSLWFLFDRLSKCDSDPFYVPSVLL